jgi:hypothetical protein
MRTNVETLDRLVSYNWIQYAEIGGSVYSSTVYGICLSSLLITHRLKTVTVEADCSTTASPACMHALHNANSESGGGAGGGVRLRKPRFSEHIYLFSSCHVS